MNIQNSNLNLQNVAFSGHKKLQDKKGYVIHNFYYPYDTDKYNCEVELFNISKDEKGNFSIFEKENAAETLPMVDGILSANLSEIPQINSKDGFAYRFKLTDKKTGEKSYAFDNGSVIGIFDTKNTDNKYNVVLNNRAIINKNGPMQLIMPDGYYPGVENKDGKPSLNSAERGKALASVRTHANKLGGKFYGIIKRLPEIEKEGISRIVGTPFTKDTISSHKYWTENAYQVSPEFGTEEEFKDLQKELFKHDINWISDAALVNEGLQGIHLSELLRKGSDSYSKNMFRADEKISLGILPDNCDYTRMKVVNAPFVIGEDNSYKNDNKNYDPSKPTYIQFYDERLASEEQKKSDSVFTTYKKTNTDNIYDITKHDDAVYPFSIEVSPQELQRNFKNVAAAQMGKIDLSDIDTIKKVADFANFNVVNKSAAGGLEVWDGNVDIAKLNFYRSSKDDSRFTKLPPEEKQEAIADFDRGALAVRDYAVNSGKYWTKLTDDTQFEYVSSLLGNCADTSDEYMAEIEKLAKKHLLPASVLKNIDKEIIENVLTDNHHLRRLDDADMRADINPEGSGNDYNTSDYILRHAMDVPLETLPVSTNLLEILTSPYIAKKANTEEELGVSRYDLTKADNPNLPKKYEKVYSQVDDLYTNKISPKILEILEKVPNISDENGEVTEYGKYVISEVTPELTKYILIKSIAPDADIDIEKNGHVNFSKVKSEDITMQSLGIPYSGKTLEEEAQIVVNIISKGISELNTEEIENLKNKMKSRFSYRKLNDFKVAEMIMDRTEAGLGWRIDAAKDIAAIDAVRSDAEDMESAWKNVVDFWKLFNQSVLEINPHSYTTAEITDMAALMPRESGALYENDGDAERKFLQETGITSIANYNYFFSLLPDLFSNYSFENGSESWMSEQGKNFELRNKLDTGWDGNPGFLFQSPDDGVINSYTFFGNHDKPRALHCLSLDMNLFYSDFSKDEDKKTAANVLQKEEKDIDFDKINAKAIAMGERLNSAFDIVVKDNETKTLLKKAVADIAGGNFKGKEFDSEAFGTRPFEIALRSVFEQVEYSSGVKISDRERIELKTLENILTPAFDRFYSMYKLLVTLPGSPTDFAGDKAGATGAETKAKNYHQQNRNVIHWEWLEDGEDNQYKFVKEFYENMNKISNLRHKKELSALNDGSTVSIPVAVTEKKEDGKSEVKYNEKLQAMLRYNDKGSVIISLHDISGSDSPLTEKMKRKYTRTDTKDGSIYNRIVLNTENVNAKQGLKHGLKVGTKFKNEREGDNSVYKIAKMQKDGTDYYYLRREDSQGRELPITIKPEDFNTLILYKI